MKTTLKNTWIICIIKVNSLHLHPYKRLLKLLKNLKMDNNLRKILKNKVKIVFYTLEVKESYGSPFSSSARYSEKMSPKLPALEPLNE